MQTDTDSSPAREDVFFSDPNWPSPIQEVLETCRIYETFGFYHAQLLFAFGALLRALVGFLASKYLYDASSDDAALDSRIAADLRRPTYGNLLAFLRACIGARQIEWGPLAEVVRAVGRALRVKHAGMVGVPEGIGLFDTLIRYRNGVAHGGRALTEQECRARIPALEGTLCALFGELRVLRSCAISTENGPHLHIGGSTVPLFPLAYEDPQPVLGIMEGYDTDRRLIRFVCVHKEWEASEPWTVWADLLQRRGLLAKDWDDIDENWLRRRSAAFLPTCYRLPGGFTLPDRLGHDLRACIEYDGSLAAHDPDFAVAALYATLADRICFVLDPADKAWGMDVHSGLSLLIGANPCLADLPRGHALDRLLAKITVIIAGAMDTAKVADWKSLERDFSGLEVLAIHKAPRNREGFRGSDDLLPQLFDALAAEDGRARTWVDLPGDVQLWIDGLEKARFVAFHPEQRASIDPVRMWREYLLEILPRPLPPGLADRLIDACRGDSPRPARPEAQLLADVGALRVSSDGGWAFADEWARAATFGAALAAAKGRQQKRLADDPPVPLTRALAVELSRTCRSIRYKPPLASRGGQALMAIAALDRAGVDLPTPLPDAELKAVLQACLLLVSWGHPEAVDWLAGLAWEALGGRTLVADDQTIAVASAVRKHGSPRLAEAFFASLASHATPMALRAKHELAGVLRDRGTGDDRQRAAILYDEILADPTLSLEQRVRTLCGAAENLLWLEDFDEARNLLREALVLSSYHQPKLRAMALHRLATTCLHQGAYDEALEASTEAVRLLEGRFQGGFASRCLDIHSRSLTAFGRYDEAEDHLIRSLEIKRATGDRLGLQKGLLQLCLLRERKGSADATAPAMEALELAVRSNDLLGQRFIHQRLATIHRRDPEARAYHLGQIRKLSEQLEEE